MRVLADEEMESLVVHRLRSYGHDVVYVAENPELRGTSDSELAEHASENQRLILTHDSDFLVMSEDRHAGVLFVPNSDMTSQRIADAVDEISLRLEIGDESEDVFSTVYVTEDWL